MSNDTLYLGDDLTILGSNVHFNNANVTVKDPVSALNVANKGYVDTSSAILNGNLQMESAARSAEDAILLSMINVLQTSNADLSIQLNNLYQYFFNQDRTGPVPIR